MKSPIQEMYPVGTLIDVRSSTTASFSVAGSAARVLEHCHQGIRCGWKSDDQLMFYNLEYVRKSISLDNFGRNTAKIRDFGRVYGFPIPPKQSKFAQGQAKMTLPEMYPVGTKVELSTTNIRDSSKISWILGTVIAIDIAGNRVFCKYDNSNLAPWFEDNPANIRIPKDYVIKPKPKKDGFCPKCQDEGEWRMLALFCRNGHGRFAG